MSTRATTIIDDQGRAADSRSLNLRLALGAAQLGDRFADYAIRNLGFVAIRPHAVGVEVRLRPTHVAPAALTVLVRWLVQMAPARVMVARLDTTDWQYAIVGDATTACREFRKLAKSRRSDIRAIQHAERTSARRGKHRISAQVAALRSAQAALAATGRAADAQPPARRVASSGAVAPQIIQMADRKKPAIPHDTKV